MAKEDAQETIQKFRRLEACRRELADLERRHVGMHHSYGPRTDEQMAHEDMTNPGHSLATEYGTVIECGREYDEVVKQIRQLRNEIRQLEKATL